jgi:hypothetical protein
MGEDFFFFLLAAGGNRKQDNQLSKIQSLLDPSCDKVFYS